MRNCSIITVLTILVTFTCITACQEDEVVVTADLNVYVSNSGGGFIDQAIITLTNADGVKRGTASEFGKFPFEDIPVGEYLVKAEKSGFLEAEQEIVVNDNGTNEIHLTLEPETIVIVTPDSLWSAPTASFVELEVKSNSSWTISESEEWIEVTTSDIGGDQLVGLDILANTTELYRYGVVVVKEADVIKNVVIAQPPKFQVQSLKLLNNNRLSDDGALFEISFNQAITIDDISVITANSNCKNFEVIRQSADLYHLNNTCYFSIGGSSEFILNGRYADGSIFKDTLTNDRFLNRTFIEGEEQKSFVDEISNSFWVSTRFPTAIYQLDRNDLSIKQQIIPDLSGNLVDFELNHQRQEIYILDSNQKIFVYDLSTGILRRQMNIPRDEIACDGDLVGIFQNLLFTKNGTGMILFSDHFGCSKLYFFDENGDVELSLPEGLLQQKSIRSIGLNYDGTNVLIFNNSVGQFIVYDDNDQSFRSVNADSDQQFSSLIRVHRKDNGFIGLDQQTNYPYYVSYEDGSAATFSYIQQLYQAPDFDYTNGNEGNLFFLTRNDNDSFLSYFNINSGTETSSYFLRGEVTNVISDLDGDNLTLFSIIPSQDRKSVIYQVSDSFVVKE
ncbi:MAG: carboxypeptidase regulatory-like domain-containing protein [Bacteroidota bacterium]